MRHNEKEFTQRVREASDQNQEKTVKECKQKINKAQKRHKELDGLVKKLYEGNATGKIPDKHFTRLLNEYDEEQTWLETSIAEWQRQIESWNADKLKTDQFIQLVKRYTDFSELTTPMLNEFIEKVIVHEGEGREKRKAALSEYQKTEKQGRIVGKSNLLDFSTNADGGEISPYSDLYFLLSNNQIELLFFYFED